MVKRIINWFKAQIPTREALESNRFLRPIAHRVLLPELWRFTRRSVPRGVALGLIAGFWIPFGLQTFVGGFLALPFKANVPLTLAFTFITNPFSYPFWIVVANRVGDFILQVDAMTYGQPLNTQMRSEFGAWLSWFLEEAGVTAFGFVVLGIIFGAIGYLLSSFGWRWWIARKRRQSQLPKILDQHA